MKHNTFLWAKNHFLLISLLSLFVMAACEDQASCVSDNTSEVSIQFYKITGAVQRTQETVDSIQVTTADGRFVTNEKNVSGLTLPLDPTGNQVRFVLSQDTATDVIELTYNREQQVISAECGVDQRYFDLSIAQQSFDSVEVLEPEIKKSSNAQGGNIAIYFCQYDLDDTVKLNFYKSTPRPNNPPTISADTLVFASVTDDRGNRWAASDTVSSLRVPINPEASQTALFFARQLADGTLEQDTLVVSYRTATVQLARCLPQTRYDQLDTLRYTFDSLAFSNIILDQNNAENIRIFY